MPGRKLGIKNRGLEVNGRALGSVSQPNFQVSIGSTYILPDSNDLHAHYDATKISASDGDSVSTWSDQTSNGYDLTAGTSPTYKTGIINNNPVVRFDGTDDYLNASFSVQTQPNHVFIVFDIQRLDDPTAVFDNEDQSSNRQKFGTNNGNWDMYAGASSYPGAGNTATTEWHIASVIFDGANSEVHIDGSSVYQMDPGSDAMVGFELSSNTNDIDMDVGEVLIYPQDKSGIRTDVESYLSDKWGITI